MSLNFQGANLDAIIYNETAFYPTNIHHAWDMKNKIKFKIKDNQ